MLRRWRPRRSARSRPTPCAACVDAPAVAAPLLAAGVARGDVANGLLGGYWPPLWTVVLAGPQALLDPSPEGAVVLAHVIAAACFLVSCAAFHRLVLGLVAWRRARPTESGPEPTAEAARRQDVLLVAIAWAAFAFLALRWAHPGEITGDILAGPLVILTGTGLLHILVGGRSIRSGVLVGAASAAAFLASPPLLVLVLAAAAATALLAIHRRAPRPLIGLVVAAGALLVPYAIVLSAELGRPTIGESMRYERAWDVAGLTRERWWAGQVEGFGAPVHPPRVLVADPLTIDLRGDPRSVGEPPFESTWWNAGVSPPVRIGDYVSAVGTSGRLYAQLVPGPERRRRRPAAHARRPRPLPRPRGRPRAAHLGGRRAPHARRPARTAADGHRAAGRRGASRRRARRDRGRTARGRRRADAGFRDASLVAVIVVAAGFAAKQPLADLVLDVRGTPVGHEQVEVAGALHAAGLRAGDGVATVDRTSADGWVALGGFRVVGIIVSVGDLAHASPENAAAAVAALARGGARAIVVRSAAPPRAGWRRVTGTDYQVMVLQPPRSTR